MDGNNQNNQYGQDSNSQYSGNQNPNSQYNNYQYGQDSNAQHNNQYGANANNYQDYTSYTPYQAPINAKDHSANGLQIASLICGILGICLSCCIAVPGLILGIAGIICGIIGNKQSTHGVGIAGLVCSIIALICGVIMAIYWGASFGEAIRLLEEVGYY